MPLIKNGEVVEDTWNYVPDEDPLPIGDGQNVTVSMQRFQSDHGNIVLRRSEVGVRLFPGDDPILLKRDFNDIYLIEIDFPKYTDGRGYSLAQLLRRRLGYTGELRAVGHVLRDQLLYMHRSGFDAFETSRADLPSVLDAMGEYSSYYQPAADGARHVFAARHSK